MFKRFGSGGAAVDTVLHDPNVQPGGVLQGVVNVTGGGKDVKINFIELKLEAIVKRETDNGTQHVPMAVTKQRVAGEFPLAANQQLQIPFQFQVPFESPFNMLMGQRLPQVKLGIRTELDIARAIDKGDLDEVQVHALPVHEEVAMAVAQLGFQGKKSDVEYGSPRGAALPFRQEVEFGRSQYYPKVKELELVFLTGPQQTEVVIDIEKRGIDKKGRLAFPTQGGGNPAYEIRAYLDQIANSYR